jgi:hypothetical protein
MTLPRLLQVFSSFTHYKLLLRLSLLLGVASGCGSDDDAAPTLAKQGEACTDASLEECEPGLQCEARADGGGRVCSAPVTLSGSLRDALSDEPVSRALVFVLDATGTPITQAETNADGEYSVSIAAPREEDGSLPEDAAWTLSASAQGYQPFPYGLRTAVPITANQVDSKDGQLVLNDDNADVVLLPLTDADDFAVVQGQVDERAVGALVVPAPFGMVGPDGRFTIFNVPQGDATLTAYRRGISVKPKAISVVGDTDDVSLSVDDAKLANVSGSINIVNAPGGSLTSVVLVPESVFDPISEKGPVPVGMRVPDPPKAPNVSGAFEFESVSPGKYVVLAAFENDGLVRDPDTNIGGTELQTIEVSDSDVTVEESFKVTEALAVGGPGADGVEEVGGAPTFTWADDSSEDIYAFVLRSALGEVVWEQPAVPGVSGDDMVTLEYAGPELTKGMFYQFSVTSLRDTNNGEVPISRTEDLRGVFRVK